MSPTIFDNCYHCKSPIGLLETIFPMIEATKPKGSRHRYKPIGKVCQSCDSSGKPLLKQYESNLSRKNPR